MPELSAIITAILLGIVEGLTEFIPVSSTGHLILIIDILKWQGPEGKIFEIIIQLGAILAICWLYRQKLWHTASTLHSSPSSRHFAIIIAIAFLPAAILGVMFHGFIKEVLFSPWVVSVMLIIGGIIIILVEKRDLPTHTNKVDDISFALALKIGFCQAIAMIPGTSRSGATIIGSLLLGVDRRTATEFSFFLAIPTMLGATVYDIYKNYALISTDDTIIIIAGFISAFLAALLVVSKVIEFISRHGFIPFAYYRIALGSLMLILLFISEV